jgi:hypothetical protein
LEKGYCLPPEGVHLHQECRAAWFKRWPFGGRRYECIGDVPARTPCLGCHRKDGNIGLFVDHDYPDVPAQSLHSGCAASWFVHLRGEIEPADKFSTTELVHVEKRILHSRGFPAAKVDALTAEEAHALLLPQPDQLNQTREKQP